MASMAFGVNLKGNRSKFPIETCWRLPVAINIKNMS